MTTFRADAMKKALSQLGVTEHPANSNSGPMVNKYLASTGLGPGYPWCMAFVHWCYKQVGLNLGGGASVGNFQEWARQRGALVLPKNALPGDIVCYNFTADNWPDHVGIVTRNGPIPGTIRAVEGNTAIGNDANGGKVMIRTRRKGRCQFVRIPGVRSNPHIEYRPVVRQHGMVYIEPVKVDS